MQMNNQVLLGKLTAYGTGTSSKPGKSVFKKCRSEIEIDQLVALVKIDSSEAYSLEHIQGSCTKGWLVVEVLRPGNIEG